MKVSVDGGVELLYREHGERLWRAVMAFTGDREVASDAVAEAFAQALRRGDAIRDPLRWIWRAAFRIAAGELKERGRFRDASADPGYDPDEPVTDLLEAAGRGAPAPLRRLSGEGGGRDHRLDHRGGEGPPDARPQSAPRPAGRGT